LININKRIKREREREKREKFEFLRERTVRGKE